MAVAVRIPLRLRCHDPTLLAGDGGDVETALRRGLERALDMAQAEVFAPRGDTARIRPCRPTFVWSDSAGQVDASARCAVERRVDKAIANVLAERQMQAPTDAPEVVPPDPSERLDWSRLLDGRYRLPSYEDPPEADVPADAGGAGEPASGSITVPGWYIWDGNPDNERLTQLIVAAIQREYPNRPSEFGIIFKGPMEDGGTGFRMARLELAWTGSNFTFPPFDTVEVTDRFRRLTPTGTTYHDASPEQQYALTRLSTSSSAGEIRRVALAAMLRSYGLPDDPPATEAEDARRLRQRCVNEVDYLVEIFGRRSNPVLGMVSNDAGQGVLLALTSSFMRSGATRLSLRPLSVAVEVSGGADGEGAGREGRRRRAGGEHEGEHGEQGTPFGRRDGRPEERRGSSYPQVTIGGETLRLDLSPFLDEPSLEDLGDLGEPLRRLMERIAYRLEMPTGERCGAFLIAAAQVIGSRASLVGHAAVTMPSATRQTEPGTGNMGDMEITPHASPAVQLLRFVAGTCPLVTQLIRLMTRIYSLPETANAHFGRYRGRVSGWLLRFHIAHTPTMRDAVGHIYMRACQVMMLQVLRTSQEQIEQRINGFHRYFPVFEGLINGFVAQEAELRALRDSLVRVTAVVDPSFQAAVSVSVQSWRDARQALSTTLSEQILNVSEMADGPDLALAGQPFRSADGRWGIRDRRGRTWTLQELESAIALRSLAASSIDPLVNQLSNVPDVVDVFRNRPHLARVYLWQLLQEMRANNLRVRNDVTASFEYAFRSGKIREDLPNRTVPGCAVRLQGVHLLAHQAIGDAFEGDGWYGIALDFVFSVELGRLGLIDFLETSLVLVVSVLCPYAGAALGLAFAARHHAEATERERIAASVLDPSVLYDRTELELDLFLAELEVALSIIPEVGTIARGASRGAVVIGRRGVRRGVVRLGLEARRAVMRQIAQQARRGLAGAFVSALATDRMMALVMPRLLGPVIQAVDAELRMMSARTTGGPPSAPAAPPTAERAEPAARRPSSGEPPEPDTSFEDERRTPLEDQP